MIHSAYYFLRRLQLALTVKEPFGVRVQLARAVCGMALKEWTLSLRSDEGQTQGGCLGYRVRCPSYRNFAFLFYTIFLRRDYDFISDQERPFIVDCGSNMGMSVLWFKWKRPGARILAFEPDEAAFNCLRDNVERNQLSDVAVHQVALAKEDGQRELYADASDPAGLGTSLTQRLFEQPNREVVGKSVACAALSSFIDQPIDMLKLDVEGSESEVLDDLAEHGHLAGIGEMFIEYHFNESNPENSLAHILTLLEQHGHRYVLSPVKIAPNLSQRHRAFKLNIYAYPARSQPREENAAHQPRQAAEDLASCR